MVIEFLDVETNIMHVFLQTWSGVVKLDVNVLFKNWDPN